MCAAGNAKNNADTITWYIQEKENGLTQEQLKLSAIKFFGNHLENINKKTISIKLLEYYGKYVNFRKNIKERYKGQKKALAKKMIIPLMTSIWKNLLKIENKNFQECVE